MDFKCSAPFIVNYPDVLAITTFFISSLLLALRNHKKKIFGKMYLQFSSENVITIYFPTKSCHFHASWFSFLKTQFNYLLEGTHYTFLFMIYFPSRKCVNHSVLDYSSPGSSLHGILQAIILEWVASPFSRVSSICRDWTRLHCRQIALQADSKDTIWAMREARKVAVKVWSIEPQRSVSLDSGYLWDRNYFHNNSFFFFPSFINICTNSAKARVKETLGI